MKSLIAMMILLFPCVLIADTPERTIYVYITVDWEGVDFKDHILHEKDLGKICRFRAQFPDCPMIHYLNAAYYTNGELAEAEVTKRIKSVLSPQDQLGLHIHAWENLTDAAGVQFISGPTFFGYRVSPPMGKGSKRYPRGHRGGDVPLWLYPKQDIRKLIRFSLKKLEEHGFVNINTFRAGGWMANDVVLDALIEEGFRTDSSPMPYETIENLYPGSKLAEYTKRLWPNIRVTSEPYKYKNLLLMPDNACLADYVDSAEFMEIVHENLAVHYGNIHIVYGFHTETAVEYLDRVEKSVLELREFAEENKLRVIFSTFERQPR